MQERVYEDNVPPTLVNAESRRGNVIDRTDAQKRLVATAHDLQYHQENRRKKGDIDPYIPISLCVKGNTSAEYVKGTGPSPGE